MISQCIKVEGLWHVRNRQLPDWDQPKGSGWRVHARCGATLHVVNDYPWNRHNEGVLVGECQSTCAECAALELNARVSLELERIIMRDKWTGLELEALAVAIQRQVSEV